MQSFSIRAFSPPGDAAAVRGAVREFLRAHQPPADAAGRANSWAITDRAFTRALGEAGYIGMIWPKAYGGHDRHPLHRYIVLEELLAAGAPVGMHWITDRQGGPLILRYGAETLKARLLPPMARGELYTCIGMSEPGSGSDLASVRTRGRRVDGGWRVDGQKVWTTNAHNAHYMITLVRTGEGSQRQEGLSQLLIDMTSPGVTVRPIIDLVGGHDFNEVFLDGVFVPDALLIGAEGAGWKQVTAELSLERSGPERYLSSLSLLLEFIRVAGPDPAPAQAALIGELTAQLWVLRQMSMSTAAKLAVGEDPALEAAIVKDLGNSFEQHLPRAIQAAIDVDLAADCELARALALLLQVSASFSLRGGTREVLRGIVARGLGLR